MLKWTASAQKLAMESPSVLSGTPCRTALEQRRRRVRRATIANKENIPYATSTPMVAAARNSPLADILNITPEIPSLTPEPRKRLQPVESIVKTKPKVSLLPRNRRHSTIGITLPSAVPFYARTLPRFQVEEYSPSGVSPTGQQLALRGLVPDPFLSNARYFQTPDLPLQRANTASLTKKSVLKKRKLDLDFVAENETPAKDVTLVKPPTSDVTAISSARMGDETLDKLIDAILDSARKDVKKKKSRKSFNLRRRTLLKTHAEAVEDVALSPSYAAGDDPASDLCFLSMESALKCLESPTKTLSTPAPATPPPGTPIPQAVLCQLPTPTPSALNVSTTTFKLETPVRTHARKRRTRQRPETEVVGSEPANRAKKFKVDARNYFEIGVALPSIYV